jgi:hypothetical protein
MPRASATSLTSARTTRRGYKLTSEESELLRKAMEILVGYLGSVRKLDGGRGDAKTPVH